MLMYALAQALEAGFGSGAGQQPSILACNACPRTYCGWYPGTGRLQPVLSRIKPVSLDAR